LEHNLSKEYLDSQSLSYSEEYSSHRAVEELSSSETLQFHLIRHFFVALPVRLPRAAVYTPKRHVAMLKAMLRTAVEIFAANSIDPKSCFKTVRNGSHQANAMAVAQAKGVVLSIKEPRDAWTMAAAGLPFEFKTSMLQSLERGLVTEVDFINGSVVRAGQECGIPTPVNQTLVACVKGIEHRILHFPWASTPAAAR